MITPPTITPANSPMRIAGATAVTGFPTVWAQNLKDITLNHTGMSYSTLAEIGKQAESVYVAGRTRSWIKLKCRLRQDLVIAGYTAPGGTRG